MSRVDVSGGPADGHRVRDAGRERWLDAETAKGFVRPGPGRALYVLEGGQYVFAGHRVGHCEGCGGFVKPKPDGGRARQCPLCGGKVRAANGAAA